MRILQVISTPPPAWATGGCARFVHEVSKELARRGHEVTVATTDLFTPDNRYEIQKNPEDIDGIRFFRFRTVSNSLAWKYKIYVSPGLIHFLRHHLKESQVVHLQDLISVHAIATRKLATRNSIPYVLTGHGSIKWLSENKILNQWFYSQWGRSILRDAKAVTALNDTEIAEYAKLGVEQRKIHVIPNGACAKSKQEPRGIFKSKYGIREEEKIVLYLGRLHRSKGVDLLLEAFADTDWRSDNSKLVFVGPDEGMRAVLEKVARDKGIRDRVIFTGFISQDEKGAAFSDAEVLVTPSYSGFPATFLEACASGTPIVTTTNGDSLSWIQDRVGYVVQYDRTQLAQAITHILKDDELRRRFGENGRRIVKEEFGWEKIVDRLEWVYEKCLE
jgi:glycosyltransferase involved in cell wall biosynthesis